MNKIVFTLFMILLVQEIKSSNKTRCESDDQEVFNAFDCKFRKMEENQNEDYCCFIQYKTKLDKTIKGCAPLSENEYDDIEETIESYENLQDIKIQTLDCFSSFIKYSLTLIYIFLIL